MARSSRDRHSGLDAGDERGSPAQAWPGATALADVVGVALFIAIVFVGVAIPLVVAVSSRTWALDHPLAARRYALVGLGLGIATVTFWIGRVLRFW